MPPSDPEREKVQIARLRALAEESHLDPAFAEKFLNFLVAEVIHHHEQIASTGAIATPSEDCRRHRRGPGPRLLRGGAARRSGMAGGALDPVCAAG